MKIEEDFELMVTKYRLFTDCEYEDLLILEIIFAIFQFKFQGGVVYGPITLLLVVYFITVHGNTTVLSTDENFREKQKL